MKILRQYFKPLLASCVLLAACGFFSFSKTDDNLFEVSKNLKLFSTLIMELNTMYVDDFDPESLIETGMNAMVKSLDPYTVYYSEEQLEGFHLQTTGKYGGIGALIRTIEDDVIIIEPFEGFPAQKNGLTSGDKILKINGTSTKGLNTQEVSGLLKGNPGTKVNLEVIQVVDGKVVSKSLVREEVAPPSVPFAGKIEEGIVYVKLDDFTTGCHNDVAEAIETFQKDNELKGVILDLRGNPGGLLQEAIDVSGLFLTKGTSVVSTKGQKTEWDKYFNTRKAPIDIDVPLAIMISRGSASASEIVAGVMQDHDRGIVVGQQSFGKGLVQSSNDLIYNSKVKLTTAKYFLPSGRCVQAVDYSGRYADGAEKVADSLRTAYTTTNNRKVYDAGGVDPDIDNDSQYISNITISLLNQQHIFNYASEYKKKYTQLSSIDQLKIGDDVFEDFVIFLANKEYDYTSYSQSLLANLEANAEKEEFDTLLANDIQQLAELIKHDKEKELRESKLEVLQLLREEIASRYFYQKGRISVSLEDDKALESALETLKDSNKYNNILNGRN